MKTISAPTENYVSDGATLFDWLGLFWSQVYHDQKFPRQYEEGVGLLMAQLYLNFLETIKLVDRNNAPVFHRERWYPLTILRSQVGTGNGALLRIGMTPTPVIGPQIDNDFEIGKTFEIGGHAQFAYATSYPITPEVTSVLTTIADSILAPNVVFTADVDFLVVGDTVFFLRGKDPFEGTDFPRRKVINADGEEDEEILLWASDVLFDQDYIYDYFGYVLDLRMQESEFYQQFMNGLWTMYNDGTAIATFQSGIGAMLGEPTVKTTGEIVEVITSNDDYQQIITDKEVYNVHLDAVLRDAVTIGGILSAGDFLTQTLKLYDTLNPMRLNGTSEYGEELRTDVSTLFFGKPLLRAPVQGGIGADWTPSDIVHCGTDTNGNPKLKFTVYGAPEDIAAFWDDFWSYLETNNISSETCFEAYLNDIVVPIEGAVYGRLPPLEYFMRYYLKANAFALVINRDLLSNPLAGIDTLTAIGRIQDILPAHVLMFVIENRTVGPDEYSLDGLGSDLDQTWADSLSDSATYGNPSNTQMTYKDRRPVIQWVPGCSS